MTLTVIVPPAFLALTTTPSIVPSFAEETWPVSAAGACADAPWDIIKGSAVAAAAVKIDQPVRIVASVDRVRWNLFVGIGRRGGSVRRRYETGPFGNAREA